MAVTSNRSLFRQIGKLKPSMLSKKSIAVFKMLYKRFMALADGGRTHKHKVSSYCNPSAYAPSVNK